MLKEKPWHGPGCLQHLHIAALPSAYSLAWLQHEAERKAAEQKQEQEAQAAARAAEAAAQRKQEKTQQQQQQQQSAASPQQHQQQSAASPQQHQQQAGPASSGGAAAMAGTTAAAGRVEVTAASLLRIADSARAAEEQAWEVLSRARVSERRWLEACCMPQLVPGTATVDMHLL